MTDDHSNLPDVLLPDALRLVTLKCGRGECAVILVDATRSNQDWLNMAVVIDDET
ncbi:hypothetical protein [Yoonia sp. SDW83-1]|uniref:hypothetical protein n=1 Tax=Yoonia sp. SDW83-1 TaxID=3366945 RepID=UPI00398C7E18